MYRETYVSCIVSLAYIVFIIILENTILSYYALYITYCTVHFNDTWVYNTLSVVNAFTYVPAYLYIYIPASENVNAREEATVHDIWSIGGLMVDRQ